MRNWLKEIGDYLSNTGRQARPRYKFKFCNDEPGEISEGTVFIIGERHYYWKVCFRCPCGCNDVISLNLLKHARPRWRFTIRWRKITLDPSIRRYVGCKSHFYIRKGKVVWSYI